jgi:flagellar biosynthesis/type III secretory pathway protein FliH
MINTEKLLKKFQKALDEAWNDGHDDGYREGYLEGHDDGYAEGVQAQKEHIQSRLKFSEELSLSAGKGAEAVRMREMAEFLAFEYDPEEAERQGKIADENGF